MCPAWTRDALQLLATFAVLSRPVHSAAVSVVHLPNTSNVDGQLTANLGVDHFFSLWIVFNNDEVIISDEPFTILAPSNTAIIKDNSVLQQPESVKRLLSDHVVLGARIDLLANNNNSSTSSTPSTAALAYETLGGRSISLTNKEGRWRANRANVLATRHIEPNGLLVVLDDYLFRMGASPEGDGSKTTMMMTMTTMSTARTTITPPTTTRTPSVHHIEDSKPLRNATSFIENVMQVLALLKSGVRVFQHFLSRSNVSKLLSDEHEYTVFVPTDHAFQRWHPIDWGFYPFSVPEFTESVITNHFVKGKLKQDAIKSEQTAKTLGGKEVAFRRAPNLTVNGASIVKGDTPLPKGNIMFISEVLFVNEAVVSRLHQQHRDKETPPLLAFPWFGAQFLSHAFLALERDRRFTHITRFLNLADLAPHVSGTGYTFFVPTDTAFEEIGLDKMPDNYLSNGDGLDILLNHFVKGRLYDRDLKDNQSLTSLGSKRIDVGRRKENVTINKAHIVESEVFVYNLGTMFYIDKVLFAKPELLPKLRRPITLKTSTVRTTKMQTMPLTTDATIIATYATISDKRNDRETGSTEPGDRRTTNIELDSEPVPEELSERSGTMPDVLFADAEIGHNKETVQPASNETSRKYLNGVDAKETDVVTTMATATSSDKMEQITETSETRQRTRWTTIRMALVKPKSASMATPEMSTTTESALPIV